MSDTWTPLVSEPAPDDIDLPPDDIEESWVPIKGTQEPSNSSDLMETSDYMDEPAVERGPRARGIVPTQPTFDLEELIAVGGFGEVWRGRQRTLGRVVALKRLRRDIIRKLLFDVASLRRYEEAFSYEAVIAASLEHPNIVPIHDLGFDDEGYPMLAMKLVRGKAWNRLIREEIETPLEEYLERHLPIFAAVCQAVAFAHSQGVIHRDIKPSQIMVGDFGEVQLMDWGLALRLEELQRQLDDARELLATAATPTPGLLSTCGTIAFMAPEQATRSLHLMSERTDVYLLGDTLYYLLTGKPPRTAETSREALRMASEGIVIPIEERAEGRPIPKALADLAIRAMAPRPEDRPESVLVLLEGVHKHLSGTKGAASDSRAQVELSLHRAIQTTAAATPSPFEEENFDTAEIRPPAMGTRASAILESTFESLFRKLSGLGRLDLLEETAEELVNYFLAVPPRPDELVSIGSERSMALQNAGNVLMRQARFRTAREAFNEAVRLNRETLGMDPESIMARQEMSASLASLAVCHHYLGNSADATAAAVEATTITECLAMEDARQRWESHLADRLRLEGFLFWKSGLLGDAKGKLEDSRALHENLLVRQPEDNDVRASLARTLNNLAWVNRSLGRIEGGIDLMARALEIWREITNATPGNVQNKAYWLWAMRSLALMQEHRGLHSEAVYWFQTSLTMTRQLLEADPGNHRRRSELAFSHYGLARNFLGLGDLPGAERSCRDALTSLSGIIPFNPDKGRNLRDHVGCLLVLGEVQLELRRLPVALESVTSAREGARRLRIDHSGSLQEAVLLEARACLLLGKIHLSMNSNSDPKQFFFQGEELLRPFAKDGRIAPEMAEVWAAILLHLGKTETARPLLAHLREIRWMGRDYLTLTAQEVV